MLTAYSSALAAQKLIPRSWLAFVANRVMALKNDRRRFGVDQSGNWINAQPEGTFVGPDLHTAHYDQIHQAVADYWFHEYTPRAGDVVIDVGAGIGEDAVVLSNMVGPDGRVHAIEAHPGIHACLTSTVACSKLTNVDVHLLAITAENGTVSITDDANHLANSIVDTVGGIEIEAQSLDTFIERSRHQAIDLLKMNIEGAERGALLGLERQAAKIRNMAISCHDFVADQGGGDQFRTKQHVRKRLLDLGFTVVERAGATSAWHADVLFAKRD